MTRRCGPGPYSWRRLLGPGKTDFCGHVCEVALPNRRRFHLVGFLTFAYIRCPLHRWCPDGGKYAFAALNATSSSGRQFLAGKPCYRLAFGMHNLSLSNGFCLCGRYLRYHLIACPDLFPVRGSKTCPPIGSLRVPFGADLILPSLTVSLVDAQVLPTDGANCKVTI